MTPSKLTTVKALFVSASAFAFVTAAQAQDNTAVEVEVAETPADIVEEEPLVQASVESSAVPGESETAEAEELSEDDIADQLNSQQQLQQTFTLKRKINGEVVETEKRTVTFDRNQPYRETEAGMSALESVKAAFDGEVLTRPEAFEEAKLDFTIADTDRSGDLTSDEFAELVDSWRITDARQADAPTKDIARQRQYDAFLEEIDPNAAAMQNKAFAKEKFAFMAGASTTITREAFIREYLLDFDSMDTDKDTLLKDNELMRFRALNRGETIDM